MPYGIVDYLLRARESACFYLAAELGFDCLDLAVDRIGDPTRLLFDPHRPREIQQLVTTTGVSVSALYAIHFLRENLVHAEERQRRPAVLALRGLAEHASALSIPTIVVPLLGASRIEGDAESIAFQQVLEQIASWSDLENVRFALKTDLPIGELLPYVDRVGSGSLGVCFDPAIARGVGNDPVRELALLRGRILHVHLKDRARSGPAASLGAGELPWEPILEALAESGYRGPLVLETPAGASPVDSARTNLSYCRQRAG